MKIHTLETAEKKSLLGTRAAQDLLDLPRGRELVSDLKLAILRLRKEGAQKDALRLYFLNELDRV